MKSWRQEVIENENTMEQKINNFTAKNHWYHTAKYKMFTAWKKLIKFRRAFEKLIPTVKVFLSKYLGVHHFIEKFCH